MLTGFIDLLILGVPCAIGTLIGGPNRKVGFWATAIVALIGFLVGLFGFIPLAYHQVLLWCIWVTFVIGLIASCLTTYDVDWSDIKRPFWLGIGSLGLMILLGIFTSSAISRSQDIANLIEPQKVDKKFMAKVNPEKIRLVPKEVAIRIARTVISKEEIDGNVLGSMLNVMTDETTVQEVGGEMYWLVPLEYDGFWKQQRLGAIPAYIAISAYDPEVDPLLVTKSSTTGNDIRMEYSLGGWWSRRVTRKMWSHDITDILTDYSFKVDDDWHPYVVASIVEPQVGWSHYKVVGIKVLNLQTGQINEYALGEIPYWIERVIPVDNAIERIDKYGTYKNGWWDGAITKAGVKQTTSGSTYTSDMFFVEIDSQTYWFSGLSSSSSSDNSLAGAVFMNTRSYETYIIDDVSGPDEAGVIQGIEADLGANKQVWHGTQPIPYNIYGELTWVVPLVSDETHYWQGVGLMSMRNVNIKVWESDLRSALESYIRALPGNNVVDVETIDELYKGIIKHIRLLAVDGRPTAYFQLDTIPKVFVADASQIPEFYIAQPGMEISVRARNTGEKTINVFSLTNGWLKGESDRFLNAIEPQHQVDSTMIRADEFDKLTPKQKRKAVEMLK